MPRLALVLVLVAFAVAVLPAAPAPAADVGWDRYSLRVGGRPVFVNGAEVHPHRMPGGPPQWRRVLRTLRAAGIDTISIYVFWNLHEPAPGRFRFGADHDLEGFLRVARDENLRVIARIGPYAQGEVDAGGYPGWLLGRPAILRTRERGFTRAWRRWFAAVVPRLARWQSGERRDGPVVAVQVENEHPGGGAVQSAAARAYMADLTRTAKRLGVRVPVTHNDVQANGSGISRGWFQGVVDVFAFDNYPYGFTCCAPWGEATFRPQVDVFEDWYRGRGVRRSPLYVAEVQGGLIAFADDGSSPAQRYRTLAGYETVQSLSLLGQGLTMVNRYMTYGGTNPGNDLWPNQGTSYDYAAPVREWEGLGPRYDELRRVGLLVRAAERSLVRTDRLRRPPVRLSEPRALYRVRRSRGDGTLHVFLRHADRGRAWAPRVTVDGRTTPPVPLPGRSARWLLARAELAGWRIGLSSAEVVHADRGTLVLMGDRGRRYAAWVEGRRTDFVPRRRPRILRRRDGRRLVVLDRAAAARLWPVRGRLVLGPHLVAGSEAQTVRRTRTLVLAGGRTRWTVLPGPRRVRLPALRSWRTRSATPERRPGHDDSAWARLRRPTTANAMQPLTSPVLALDDNGVPGTGFAWYRGRFRGRAPSLCLEGRHRYHVWLNGRSLGTVTSDDEVPGPSGFGGLGVTGPVPQPVRIPLPATALRDGENVVAVLVESWGHNMDAVAANQAKQMRGLISASLGRPGAPACGFVLGRGGEQTSGFGGGEFSTRPPLRSPSGGIAWRLRGGRPADFPNVSGLSGERAGWHRTGFDDRRWRRVRLPRLLGIGRGEVAWYRTAFRLRVPRDTRAAVGLRLPASSFPAEVYLNGVHIARAGRDRAERFVLPDGVLRPRGRNVLALARWDVGATRRLDRPRLFLYETRRVTPLGRVLSRLP